MSDWKEAANRRRDARHVKAPDAPTKAARLKRTRQWCRGKVGTSHTPACFIDDRAWYIDEAKRPRLLRCAACGKQIAYWYPYWTTAPRPSWVDK